MATTNETSQIEDKIKLSLLQLEKRVVDLEVAVEEVKQLKEKLKDIDASSIQELKNLPDIKQKISDLEDLIMVESLGVEEFKKLLEELKTAVETRLKDVDVNQIRESIKSELSAYEEKMKSLKGELESAASALSKNPEFVALKQNIDKFISEKVGVDLKIAELEKKIDLSASKMEIATLKVEDELRQLESLKETIDWQSLKEKTNYIRELEEKIKHSAKEFSDLYADELKKLEVVKNLPQQSDFKEIKRRIDELRMMVQDRVRKEEVLKLLEETNKHIQEVERKVLQEQTKSYDVKAALKKEFEPVISALSMQISVLLNRLVAIESRLSAIEKEEKEQSALKPIILE